MALGSMVRSKGATEKMLYGTDGKMVYKPWIEVTETYTGYRDTYILDSGFKPAKWQDAYDAMVADTTWSSNTYNYGHNAYVDGSGWRCYIGATRYYLQYPQTGLTLTRVTIPNVSISSGYGLEYQFKILMQNSLALPATWNDCVSSPQYSGSDVGTVAVTCNAASNTHLIILCSFTAASWFDPHPYGVGTITWDCGFGAPQNITLRYQ